MTRMRDAASLGVPETFNAATYFVDRNVEEGRGASIAIECLEERVTYAQLLERVNRCGSALRHTLGVRVEERVALLLLDTPAFAYSFFGAIKAGAVAIPLNTLWKPSEYEYVLADSRARVLIVSAELLPRIEALPPHAVRHLEHVVVVGGTEPSSARTSFDALLAGGSPRLDAEPVTRDDVAFWLYSSGSTGKPKGCVHLQHDMVVSTTLYARNVLDIRPTDRCFSVAKLFFAYGLGNALYFPFAVGATTILWPGPPVPADVFAVIERHRPTLLFSVPTGYAMALGHERADGPDFDLSSVRFGVSAGESLPASIFERFRARFGVTILDGIGSTEILHIFISNRPGDVRPGASGQVVDGYEAQILDDDKQVVARGEVGNLWIKGDSTCAAYWNQHEKTKSTIEGQWIKTGDRYSQDDDGFFWYAGRSDDMLKVGGQWVSPVEVESALIEHAAVLECGVIGREDRDALVKPAAFVVLRQGVTPSPDLARELQQHVRQRLADYKRPRWVEFLPELPRTATGKIQRFKLRDRDRSDR